MTVAMEDIDGEESGARMTVTQGLSWACEESVTLPDTVIPAIR
jgi:hypothetical protein